MPDVLLLLDTALRGALLALLGVFIVALRRDRAQWRGASVGVALGLGLCVQVLSSAPWFEAGVPRLWQAPAVAVSVANGLLFWLFVQALFDDRFALRPWHGGVWLAVAALSAANCAWLVGSGWPLATATVAVQRMLPLVFAALALWAALRHWRADLVEARRHLRLLVLGGGVLYTLVLATLRLASPPGRLDAASALLDVSGLLALVALLVGRMLVWNGAVPGVNAVLSPDRPADSAAPVPDKEDPADAALAQALQQLMRSAQVYREEGLTLARLAQHLQTPEYRLRRVINQRLGHRNFNAYINGLRLQQASQDLRDPALSTRPVLSIALDAGFQSIGPFNRAFKAALGLTPTQYRQQHLADS